MKTVSRTVFVLWGIAFILGLYGLVTKFSTAERLAGYGSYVPWGLWIAVYFHLIGIAGGVFAVSVIGYFLNIAGFRESLRVTLVVSGICVLCGLFSVWLDLGQPFRAANIMFFPNFGSMMAFNAWMYNVFFLVIVVIFVLSLNKDRQTDRNDKSGWLIPLLSLGFLLSIAYPSQSGAFFGVVDAKPFWNSPLLPLLFLGSAITSGAAVLLLVYLFVFNISFTISEHPFKMLRYTIIGGIVFYFICEFAEFSLVFWSPNSDIREAVRLVMFGPFWWVFWGVHLGGAFLALFLLLFGRTANAVGTGAFVVAVTFISARLNILIPGQAVAQLKGLQDAFYHSRLRFDYAPSVNEYLVAIFVAAMAIGLMYAGIKLLSRYTSSKIGEAI
ncbi:MAG: NrfD/PsrC family molybdoenzyme membrane anchor subunit [Pseudomonadota bacterium]